MAGHDKGLLQYRIWNELHCKTLKVGLPIKVSKDYEYSADWRGVFPVTGIFINSDQGLSIELTDGGSVYDSWKDEHISPANILDPDDGPTVEIKTSEIDLWERTHAVDLVPGMMVELIEGADFKLEFPHEYMVSGIRFDIQSSEIDVCLMADEMNFDGFSLDELKPALNDDTKEVA